MSDTEKLPTDTPEVDTQKTEKTEEAPKESSESQKTIEDTKQQLAEVYLRFLDAKKEGVVGVVAWLGANINPLQKEAVAYLTTEASPKKEDIFSNFGKNLKQKLSEKFLWGTVLEYNKADLNKMKALISQYKNDQAKLQELMAKIEEGIDPTTDTSLVSPEVKTAAVATTVATWVAAAEVYNIVDDIKAEGTGKYFKILSGSSDVHIKNIDAKKTIEQQLTPCTFFGKKITINKYIIPRLQQVEKEIKAANIDYSIKNIWGYNRRNVSWWSSVSYHALWLALDINPAKNPYVKTQRPDIPTDMPKEFVDIFKKNGFVWWGDRWNQDRKPWETYKADAMHFQFSDEKYLREQKENDIQYAQAA